METASSQPEPYLDSLLPHLACPVDGSFPLKAIRQPDGQVTALRSAVREYPVLNNVPCLIPDLGKRGGRREALWRESQDGIWRDYQSEEEDIFSGEDDSMGLGVGEIIRQMGAGLFLDVGCGVLPLPGYMAVPNDTITWIGIDPFFGHIARQFPFAQAVAEYLPFRPQIFDGLLYAGTIDFGIDPVRSLRRARTVIRPQGRLFIWEVVARANRRYRFWKTLRALGIARRYDSKHQWAFTDRAMRGLLKRAGFAVEEVFSLCERYCPHFDECGVSTHFLFVARCA